MNLYPAFLHGEQALVALLFAGIIALLGVPVLYFWLWHTKVSALKLAIAYFVIAAVMCAQLAFGEPNPGSIPSLTASALGLILSLPWSVGVGWVLSTTLNLDFDDRAVGVVMLFGAGVNAVLLYFAAAKMRRLID